MRDAGHETKCVRNVTDVDDDILRKARELGVHYLDLAAEEMARFDAEMGLLNLLPIYPLDGGQIAQQIFVLTNSNNRQDAIRQSLILSVIIGGMMGVIAFMQWHNTFLAILFVWLTYSNFTMLQSFHGHRGSY